jgi:uncharacterized membrane protein HdeD (DUF308 family)
MIIAGVLAIVIPPAAGIAVLFVVAWLLILSGAVHLVFAWHTRNPMAGLATLTLFLAIYLFLEGVLELVLSFRLRPLPGSNWLLFDGIITLILAILIWRSWPWSTEWVIGTLLGISMLFSGAARLSLSLAARRVLAKLA